MGILFIVLILGGIGYYFTKPEERSRAGHALLAYGRDARETLLRHWNERAASDDEAPREPLPLATAAIVIVNVLVFVEMLVGDGVLSDEATLVSWGANFGPRTTNGEWWRLAAALFVHSGYLQLIADLCGLVLIGVVVERLVGSLAFMTVYFVAGILASLVSISVSPMGATVGASSAIFGIYGLLSAVWMWSVIQRSPVRIPLRALKALGPAVGVFVLYSALTDSPGAKADIVGFISGFFCGAVLAIGSEERRPAVLRVAAVTVATTVLAVGFAVPLRGLDDVRPEIGRILAMEGQTAAAYESAVKRFTDGHIKVGALVKIIDGTIAPQFREAGIRLKAIEHVPAEHQPLVAAADRYLQARTESWRVRSDALRTSNMRGLQKADRLEYESREAFDALKRMSEK